MAPADRWKAIATRCVCPCVHLKRTLCHVTSLQGAGPQRQGLRAAVQGVFSRVLGGSYAAWLMRACQVEGLQCSV